MKNILLLAILLVTLLWCYTPAQAAMANASANAPTITRNEMAVANDQTVYKQNKLEKRLNRRQEKWAKKLAVWQKKGNVEASINLGVIGLIVIALGGLFILLGIAIPVVGILFIVIGAIIAFVGLVLLLLLNSVKVKSGSSSH